MICYLSSIVNRGIQKASVKQLLKYTKLNMINYNAKWLKNMSFNRSESCAYQHYKLQRDDIELFPCQLLSKSPRRATLRLI